MSLIERERELEALDECLASARAGEGRLVVVQGEAGIGKTSLVREFTDSARGVKVMVGSCDPLTTPRPLGPVLDMANALAVVGGAPVGRTQPAKCCSSGSSASSPRAPGPTSW